MQDRVNKRCLDGAGDGVSNGRARASSSTSRSSSVRQMRTEAAIDLTQDDEDIAPTSRRYASAQHPMYDGSSRVRSEVKRDLDVDGTERRFSTKARANSMHRDVRTKPQDSRTSSSAAASSSSGASTSASASNSAKSGSQTAPKLQVDENADYYEILQISREATSGEVRKAYKRMAMRFHPDKNPGNREQAELAFKLVAEAYGVLSDDEKRKMYDRYGKEGLQGGIGGTSSSSAGNEEDYVHVDMKHARDLFEQFFGSRGGFGSSGMFPFEDDFDPFNHPFFNNGVAGRRSQRHRRQRSDRPRADDLFRQHAMHDHFGGMGMGMDPFGGFGDSDGMGPFGGMMANFGGPSVGFGSMGMGMGMSMGGGMGGGMGFMESMLDGSFDRAFEDGPSHSFSSVYSSSAGSSGISRSVRTTTTIENGERVRVTETTTQYPDGRVERNVERTGGDHPQIASSASRSYSSRSLRF